MIERATSHRLLRVVLPFLVLTFLAGHFIDRATANRQLQLLRSSLAEHAARHGIEIERTLTEYIQVSRGIEAAIATNPDINEAEFLAIAFNLWRNSSGIVNIAAAPDYVVKYVYPLEDNASVLGLDYRKQGAQIGSVELARETGTPVIAGPVDLVQGGRGFIVRTPVFLKGGPSETITFWGVVSVVVSETHFMSEARLLEHDHGVDLAIRGANGSGANGPMVLGDPAVFESDPVLFDLAERFGSWQLGLGPDGGWPTHAENSKLVWILVILVGAILMLVVLAFDESGRRRRIAQKQLGDAIEAIDGGFAVYDAKDRLVTCNSTYKSIYRKSAHLLVPGSTFSEIIRDGLTKGQYPGALGREEEWFRERMEAHGSSKSDILQLTDDGRWLKVSERKTPDGNTVGFRVDITELVAAREAAEAADRAKSQFLDSINHETRTPLTVLLGYISFLTNPEFLPSYKPLMECLSDEKAGSIERKNKVTALLGEITGFAEKVRISGQSLMALVNGTLDITAMDSGQLKLERNAVRADELAQSLVEKFGGDAESKHIDFRCDLGSQLACADRKRLAQILAHLVENALKFTETGFVRVSSRRQEKFVIFEVEDTGSGIADADQNGVFQSFSRGDASETRRFGGTGIGLALCKKLVELHGGTMSVASEVGKGSIFTFSIPAWVKSKPIGTRSTQGASLTS